MSDSLRPMDCGLGATVLYPWDSSGKNTGVGSHSLLQGIFLTQGSNLGLPHCRQTLYHLSHQGNWQRVIVGVTWAWLQVKSVSRVWLFVTPWTVACQAPPSMGFSRQEHCHFLLQGIFLTQGSNLGLLHCRQTLYRLSYHGIPEVDYRKTPTKCWVLREVAIIIFTAVIILSLRTPHQMGPWDGPALAPPTPHISSLPQHPGSPDTDPHEPR